MTQEKILDRLTKIKKMAEGAAAIGSEAEANAFAEMLQKLLLDHKLEMSDLEFEVMEKESPVERHRISYEDYPDIKIRKTRTVWIEKLAHVIAKAHFCRILVHSRSSAITLVGRHEDWAVAEYMIVTLQRAAEHMSDKAAYYYKLECHRKKVAVGHGFRESWLEAFITRLAIRYEEERSSRMNESTGLVRINKSEKAVEEFMGQFTKTATKLSTSTRFHREGSRRGTAAADAINLKANAVESSSARKELDSIGIVHIEGKYGEWYDTVLFNGKKLPLGPSLRVFNHSPDGFSWGYNGSGPAQLALAILLEAGIPAERAARLHQRFKSQYISRLPERNNFSIEVNIGKWIREQEVAERRQLTSVG